MRQFEKRLRDLEAKNAPPAAPEKVVIIDEHDEAPADATMIIRLVSPKLDANGRVIRRE